MKDWIIKNWKELIFFLLTWGIGFLLFFTVISTIISNQPNIIFREHWTIFFTSIFLLLLPFVSKIALGNILKVERDLKQTKTELSDLRTNTQNQFQLLATNINFLSQNVSNNINIINQIPSAETLKKENERFDDSKGNAESTENESTEKIQEELKFIESDEVWIWIFNLLKIRVEMEQFLRVLLDKRTSVTGSSNLDIKYFSLRKLFDMYIETFPDAYKEIRSFELFNNVANAAIHGQTINESQYNEARVLGVKILRNIKLRNINLVNSIKK